MGLTRFKTCGMVESMATKKVRFTTVSAAARRLGVSTTMIYKWIGEGLLEEEFVNGREKAGQFRLVTIASMERLERQRQPQ